MLLTDGPGHVIAFGVRIDVEDAELAAVGEIVGGWVDADRAAVGAERGLDRGNLRDDVVNGLAARQSQACVPSPDVHDRGHDLRSGQADRVRDVRPGFELALNADLRAAPAADPPGDAARDGERQRRARAWGWLGGRWLSRRRAIRRASP